LNLIKNCLICGKQKKEEWKSDIWIVIGEREMDKIKITICPECRKKPIGLIYEYILKRNVEKYENDMETRKFHEI